MILGLLLLGSCEQNNTSHQKSENLIAVNLASIPNNPLKSNKSNKSNELDFAENLILTYQVLDNSSKAGCDKVKGDGFCFRAAITLDYKPSIDLDDWRIYFSHMSPVQSDFSEEFNIIHYNGDLHYLEPTALFKGWSGNQKKTIEFNADFWHISEFDSPPNFYLVVGQSPGIIIKSTLAEIDSESKLEKMTHVKAMSDTDKQLKRTSMDNSIPATPEHIFSVNQDIEQSPIDISFRIIPKPTQIIKNLTNKRLNLSKKIRLIDNSWGVTTSNVAIKHLEKVGVEFDPLGEIPLRINKSEIHSIKGQYSLIINENEIVVSSTTEEGVFYALQSLASLKALNNNWLPLIEITDQPRFEFRGLLVDVARNFRDKRFIIKLLDQMAAIKMNKLHLHLGDDEGWRLEIPGLPELTQVGANRCHDLTEQICLLPQLGSGPTNQNLESNRLGNQFYSIKDYREILIAAKARHIEVIPSFDMPGHSRAAVKSMQARYKKFMALGKSEFAHEYMLTDLNDQSVYRSVQFYNDNTLNVCLESTYHFIEKIINEVVTLHKDAKVPLRTYHIGADETPGAWKQSPACEKFIRINGVKVSQLNQYFIQRISKFITSKGVNVAGWSDGLSKVSPDNMPQYVQVNAWGPLYWDGFKTAHTMANQGWQVIVSSPDVTYFDFPYEADPKERGYYWGARYTNTRQVFQFMPENLPLHAEIWSDRENNPMSLDDRPKLKTEKSQSYQPLLTSKRFKGIQGHLWGEMIRSDDIAAYMLFPRLHALAERAWHKPNWEPDYNYQGALYNQQSNYFSAKSRSLREKDWLVFANTLGQRELQKLEADDWLFRLPTPGAIIKNDQLLMNIAFPGLALQYQIDANGWQNYLTSNGPVKIAKGTTVKIRSVSPSGKRFSRVTQLTNNQKD